MVMGYVLRFVCNALAHKQRIPGNRTSRDRHRPLFDELVRD